MLNYVDTLDTLLYNTVIVIRQVIKLFAFRSCNGLGHLHLERKF